MKRTTIIYIYFLTFTINLHCNTEKLTLEEASKLGEANTVTDEYLLQNYRLVSKDTLISNINSNNYNDLIRTMCDVVQDKQCYSVMALYELESQIKKVKNNIYNYPTESREISKGSFSKIEQIRPQMLEGEGVVKIQEIPLSELKLLELKLNEITVGIKAFASYEINKIRNLSGIQKCCVESTATKNTFFLRLNYYPKKDLKNYLMDKSNFIYTSDFLWKVFVAGQIAAGVKMLHSQDYIHRDLKPQNILMRDNYWPIIGDYGIVKSEAVGKTAIGTALYTAPEVTEQETYDNKVDIYSFGLTIFEIFNSYFVMNDSNKKNIFNYCDEIKQAASFQQVYDNCVINDNVDCQKVKIEDYILFFNLEKRFYCENIHYLVMSTLDHNPANRPTAEGIVNFFVNVEKLIPQFYQQLKALFRKVEQNVNLIQFNQVNYESTKVFIFENIFQHENYSDWKTRSSYMVI